MYPNIDNRAPPPEPNQKNTPYTRWLSWIMSSSSSTSVTNGAVKLGKILDGEEILTSQDQIEVEVDGDDRDEEEVKDGYCVECEDQPAQVSCETCRDLYCDVCFQSQHRKGNRKIHTGKPLPKQKKKAEPNGAAKVDETDMQTDENENENSTDSDSELQVLTPNLPTSSSSSPSPIGEFFIDRSKFIPLRLSLSERAYLRLLEAALQVSEYTDKIDILAYSSKPKRIVQQIRLLCSILSGLLVAADYKEGQLLFAERNFEDNAEFYSKIFEIGRRHKIMNPEKMRDTYGKLMYLLMDAQSSEVQDMLNFSCVEPIRTVYTVLEDCGALDVLRDEKIVIATKEIISEAEDGTLAQRARYDIQREIKAKERAIEYLASKYSSKSKSSGASSETIRQCLYSIGDNHAFLRTNRDPCDRMIIYLKQYFHPTDTKGDAKSSLAIRSGRGGARLSHDHEKQYAYCLQSLTLWREILHDMFHLWSLAEQDLLSTTTSYRLRDTGQGLNRVQHAPKTARMMQIILNRAQKSVGSWVGSSVVHMGDHNVPNALMFIDKYTQIYRILLPVCTTISLLPTLMLKPSLNKYITSEFGGVEELKKEILGDFFRHAFDGSGADNFFDAGSCIDGRLTSAWNWCGQLEKKRYFHVFLLCGFVGFDGQW